jgi:beta-fructofuranosidase
VPTDLSDPYLKDWKFADNSPLYCGDLDHKYKPGDSPSNAWQTSFGEWRYYDAYGEVYFSNDFKSWDVADGKFPGGICQDFYELPRVCDGCSADVSSSIDTLQPTHARLGSTTWQLMAYDEGSPGEAGTVQGTSYASVALFSELDVEDLTDFGTLYCPKSFLDPIKQRRLMYGWNRGGCQGMGAGCKGSTQSLLREVTYDPRLGMLNFYPIQEYEELRGNVLAQLGPMKLNGEVSLQLPPFVANQSEVLLRFELPSEPVRFGVRLLTGVCKENPRSIPWCTPGDAIGNEFFVDWVPAPEKDTAAWSVIAGSNRSSTPPMGAKDQLGHVPILSTDKNFEMKIYIDRTYAEAFLAGGRLAMVTPLQGASLYRPGLFLSNNTEQGIEIFASKPNKVKIASATVWEMGQIWKNVTTHDLGDESLTNNVFAV